MLPEALTSAKLAFPVVAAGILNVLIMLNVLTLIVLMLNALILLNVLTPNVLILNALILLNVPTPNVLILNGLTPNVQTPNA